MREVGETSRASADEHEYRAVADFRSALRRFEHATDEVTRELGLTRRRYELLLVVKTPADAAVGTSVSEIAARLYLEAHTTTELVVRAEEAGLVTRDVDAADARVTRVRLTPTGNERLAEAAAALEPERERLTRLLADAYKRARELARPA